MDDILQFPHLSPSQQQEILNEPALPPPKGVEVNLDNPKNGISFANAISAVLLILVAFTGVARVYSRIFVVKKLRVEDCEWTSPGGYAGVAWTFYAQLAYGGFFVHEWDVRFRDFEKTLYIGVILTIVYAITIICKDSDFVGVGTESLACIPLATIWEPWLMGRRINKKILDLTTAYFNLAVDVFILALPQTIIWKLHMGKSRKIGVSIIFSLGLLTLAAATGRIYANTNLHYVNEGDTNYGYAPVYLWVYSEVSFVLLVFNAPAVPKAFTHAGSVSRKISDINSWVKTFEVKKKDRSSKGRTKSWPQFGNGPNANPYQVMDDRNQNAELPSVKVRDR
ncbi:hypothetical protein GGR57DRAFT_515707 [Xylariaceae sp. FL1272]|nr:hypothetical protein GGR57DRAFT_515707 [Xylariaceae sp. FL1272]